MGMTPKQNNNQPSGRATTKESMPSQCWLCSLKWFMKELLIRSLSLQAGSTMHSWRDAMAEGGHEADALRSQQHLGHTFDNTLSVWQFLASKNMAVPIPYSPDLAPAIFFLFPKMEIKLKKWRFDNMEDIQAESLNTLTKNNSQEALQWWQRHWDHCIQGDYFEDDGGEQDQGCLFFFKYIMCVFGQTLYTWLHYVTISNTSVVSQHRIFICWYISGNTL